MFENIGGKIKGLAKFICWLGIIGSVIYGIMMLSMNSRYNPTILPGIMIMVGGSLVSWIGSFFTYAIGEIVCLLEKIAKYTNEQQTQVYKLAEEQRKTNENLKRLQEMSAKAPNAKANEPTKSVEAFLPEL